MHIIRDIMSGITMAAVLLFVGFLISLAWNNPTQAPPGGSGAITAGPGPEYNVGVGTSSPKFKLDIDGGSLRVIGSSYLATLPTSLVSIGTKIGIGTQVPTSRLHVYDGSFTQDNPLNPIVKGGSAINEGCVYCIPDGAAALRVEVQGRYAYVTFTTSEASKVMRVIDVSDPNNPRVIGALSPVNLPSVAPFDLFVSGRYAYILFLNNTPGNQLRIIDISNSSTPVAVGGWNLITDMPTANPVTIFVSGKYAYVTFSSSGSNAFRIIDISNPSAPFVVGGKDLTSTNFPVGANYGVYVSGRYAYVNLAGVTSDRIMRILDISDPTNPIVRGSNVAGSLPNKSPVDIYVSGRYAYVSFAAITEALKVIDISNPLQPTVVGTGNAYPSTGDALAITGAGRYVYIGMSVTDQPLRIFDVVNPAQPNLVGGQNTTILSGNIGIAVSGRYAYMSFGGSGANAFRIVDITGVEAVSGSYGSFESGSLQVRENAAIDNNLTVKGGLTVGGSILGSADAAIGELIIRGMDVSGGSVKIVTKTTTDQAGACAGANGPCNTVSKLVCLAAFDVAALAFPTCNTPPDLGQTFRCLCAGLGS